MQSARFAMNEQLLLAAKGQSRTVRDEVSRIIQEGAQMPRKARVTLPKRRSGRKAAPLPNPTAPPPREGWGVLQGADGMQYYMHLGSTFTVSYLIASEIVTDISDPKLYKFLIDHLRQLPKVSPSDAPGLFVPSSAWVEQFTALAGAWCRMSEEKRARVYAPVQILRQAFRICHRAIPRITYLSPEQVEPILASLKSAGATRVLIADAAHVDLRFVNAFTPRMRKFMRGIGVRPTRSAKWKPLKTLVDFITWYRIEIEAGGSIERFAEREAKARESGKAGKGPGRASRIRRMAAEAVRRAHAFMKT